MDKGIVMAYFAWLLMVVIVWIWVYIPLLIIAILTSKKQGGRK